ncbi:dienelactone hydrolase [Cantharellus anzutake]|uniref:dienelactone hydrolase n=1 Tax=Cantharellus anzutake TaxID=1750568 RepID=UPI001902F32F|nr:dienelactone hydrolase [Cantharellus anzutake]KAF8331308.1 dienelactone hydrolase [Cantharellus anzutake]
MLVTETYHDIPVKSSPNGAPIRIFIISPKIDGYPNAKFPGVVVFSEIYQVTGPVERFAGQIASHGYVVACPSSYHEFEGPEPISYDTEGTDRGNRYKVEKELAAYDEDATITIDLLSSLPNCNGRIAATGMCLGGHLVCMRAAFDPRVLSTVCFFATDIHSASLGKGKHDDSLQRAKKGEIRGEIMMIFGKQDTHVPRAGRDLIRTTLEDSNAISSFIEIQAQHAFIRDESSKGRWDAALTRNLFGMMTELFERTVGRDLGQKVGTGEEVPHIC